MDYTWDQVVKTFGKDIADLMKESPFLDGIGIVWDPKTNQGIYFKRDIRRAYRDVCTKYDITPIVKVI